MLANIFSAPRKNIFLRATWLGLFLLLPIAPAATGSLRILSLNAEWFPGRSPAPSELAREVHMCQVQHLLADINPDILLLQEVRNREAVHELISILADFELHTISDFGFQQELAIASRFPALASWAESWEPHSDYFQPRGLALAIIELPGTGGLAVYTVHLKSNFQAAGEAEKTANTSLREASARQLIKHIEGIRRQSWNPPLDLLVVGGDLNTSQTSRRFSGEQTFTIMRNGGLDSLGLPGINHFLACPTGRQGTARILSAYQVSDHKPILLELELGTEISWHRAEPEKPGRSGKSSCLMLNINQAGEPELQLLPGIGPVLARRIIANRPYRSKQELLRVNGIGETRLQQIRPFIHK